MDVGSPRVRPACKLATPSELQPGGVYKTNCRRVGNYFRALNLPSNYHARLTSRGLAHSAHMLVVTTTLLAFTPGSPTLAKDASAWCMVPA